MRRNIAELLSQRAGVSLQTSVAGGSILNVLGMDSRYVLILIDGQPITGKFNDRVSLDQILTVQVEKVEIVKGPSSSLYGSEAMGGVINIITNSNKKLRQVYFSGRYGNTQNYFEYEDQFHYRFLQYLSQYFRSMKKLEYLLFDLLRDNIHPYLL